MGVFGSVARGDMRDSSDVDVVVEIKNIDPFILLDIREELSKLLGCKVDLIRMRKNLNKILRKRIKKEVIYVWQGACFTLPLMLEVVRKMIKDLEIENK